MKVSYGKLFKILTDRNMTKGELLTLAGVSPNSMAKLSKNKNVSMDVLIKVCTALNVDIGDIVELIPDNQASNNE
ncbi:MAG: helix-turn-helix transcriptional regulator [Firmicutes bacterium]|nr:helix-turn-helix transcriptional regulator [Bacillota bacterium]